MYGSSLGGFKLLLGVSVCRRVTRVPGEPCHQTVSASQSLSVSVFWTTLCPDSRAFAPDRCAPGCSIAPRAVCRQRPPLRKAMQASLAGRLVDCGGESQTQRSNCCALRICGCSRPWSPLQDQKRTDSCFASLLGLGRAKSHILQEHERQ